MAGTGGIWELSYEARCVHHIAKLGHEVDYWTDTPLDYGMEPVLKKPATLRSFLFHEGQRALASTPRRFHPLDLKKIIGQAQNPNHAYDVIYATATTGIDMGVFLRDMLGIPLVVQVLDIPYWRIEEWGPYEIYKHSVMPLPLFPQAMFEQYRNEWSYWFHELPKADHVSCILHEARKQVLEYAAKFNGSAAALPPEKTSVVNHGSLDVETLDWMITREPVVEKQDLVVCLNRIDFHKGVDQTVVACKVSQDIALSQGKASPKFVFISTGNQPWYEAQVKEIAHSLLKDVVFTGWIDNTAKFKLLRQAKVVVDAEWPNGFGGCCISEAIYCDAIPVTWNTPSKREVNPEGPVRVPLDDCIAMGQAIYAALSDWQAPSEEAKRFIREKRSIGSHAVGLVDAFNRVVR